jgi:hypothetical protein
MRKLIMIAALAVLSAGILVAGPSACSYGVQQAEQSTPAQQVYALQADYNAALTLALAYVDSGEANDEVMAQLRRLDRIAWRALAAAQFAVRTGTDPTATAALEAARAAIEELADYVAARRLGGPV